MADLEDVTLDGRPLQSLRVADLKAALEERGLSKSGQKNALVKRLKGALMLENLQKTSTAHVGLQPNSQIGEEMSQNSFIKQYLAKQQELLRQRLEREAREAYETNDQEDHTDVHNSTCPQQVSDASTAVTDHFKPPGPSSGPAVPMGFSHRHQEAAMSRPLASVSVAQDRNETAADSDEDESEDGEDDGDGDDDDDWDNNIQRRLPRQPVRAPMARERSAAPLQPQQQHIPSVLSPQLRQPTPPPSPPPELSFPLPDTPKQSPPSPDVAAEERSPSSSSSGSSSSGSRSSSPEPLGGHAERKPGPLTLLARKMESEGAFSGAEWHCRDASRQGTCSSSTFPNNVRPESLMSTVPHTVTASHVINLGAVPGHAQVPVLKAAAERDAELEKEKFHELQRQAQLRKHEQEQAMEEERVRAALEREQQKALEKEQFEREKALEKERQDRELALAKERAEKEQALLLERQRALERELAMQREQEERERRQKEEERAMELERARILERKRALEQEKIERERALEAERIEREKIEREKALELERLEQERLEQERLEREAALERERLQREKERIEREKALEQERIERERIEQLRALERERIEREKALEQERLERERALEQERLERERALEQERLERERAIEQERIEREKALEQERIERERALELEKIEREKALEQERIERERALEQERIEREKAIEQERLERERALEQERLKQEKLMREKALELERIEKEKAQIEQERLEREKALEQERIKRERALELERIEREKIEREKALEQERIEREKALEREKIEKERIERERIEHEKALEVERRERERALEQQRLEREKQEKERIENERALEQERIARKKAIEEKEEAERKETLKRVQLEKAEQERLKLEKAQEQNALELEKHRLVEQISVGENKIVMQKENTAHERSNDSRMADVKSEDHLTPSHGCEIGFVPLPTPPPLFTGTSRNASTEAGKQEGEVHGPVTCEGQAEESNTPKPPQPVFKKFRFTRETPLQLQSASRIIKRPHAFSDTPQPYASMLPAINADGQQQKEQSADKGAVAGQFKPNVNQAKADESAKKEDATDLTSEKKEELHKKEAAVKEIVLTAVDDRVVCPSSPVGASRRGRNVKKAEKKDLRRSSSNDSSSSESNSASSSSPSTDSSSASQGKTYTSGIRDEEGASSKIIEVAKEQKRISAKVEISSPNTQHDEGLLAKLNEASSRDDIQTRKGSEDEEKPEYSCDGESSVSEPEKGVETNNETPKAFSTRKISLSSSKSSPGSTENEIELGSAGGRKRRWGSSTAVTAKKPSISITTDSLKSLIPDIKPALNQEAVMDLHPEEPVLSETEEEEKDHAGEELQIRRTVTQIVHVENQEDGQKEAKRRREDSDEEEDMLEEKEMKIPEDSTYTETRESPSSLLICHDADVNSVSQSEVLIRRSISQQKSGVSITIDDPVRTARQPSPPRGNVSNIVHVCNLVRPFTLGQLKELLSRTGTLVEDGFWIDKIKSHCYVTYSTSEEAVATRAALHGVKWPQSNPKVLSVDFCQLDELEFHKGLGSGDRPGIGMQSQGRNLPSLLPDREQWVEREREMERRERARADREWDRDKVKEFGKAQEQKEAGARRSRSRERRRKEREKSKEKKTEKKEKPEDPPAKLLDDLFRKTKAVPCIYWLPLTEEQHLQREAARIERRKEREIQRKKEEEQAELKKKEENKERVKPGSGPTVSRSDSEKIRDRDRARERGRDRDREREVDKRRDGYRRPGVGVTPSGRRSRSRSDPRERRH